MKRRISYSTVFLATALIALPFAAPAFDIFGFKLFETRKAENTLPLLDPQLYEVTFQINTENETLAVAIRAASELQARREGPASGAAGLIATARGDYRRILAALYTEGHYGGTISIRVAGREADRLPVTADLPENAPVVISVDPGPAFTFRKTRFLNPPPLPADARDSVAQDGRNAFVTGNPARALVVERASLESVDMWRQAGHPKARVDAREIIADHTNSQLDATITLDPGRLARNGTVSVSGTEKVDPGFIRYMADIPQGQEYDPDTVQRAQERITNLNVFQIVRVSEADSIDADGNLPFIIEVQDRKPRRIGVGATISSLDGAGVEAFWLHRNLFGRAERLRIDASVTGLGQTTNAGNLDYVLGAGLQKPGVFTPDTTLTSSLFVRQTVLETYRTRSLTASLGLARQVNRYLSGSIDFELSRSDDEDMLGLRRHTTASLLGTARYDRRDSMTDATQGYLLSLEVHPFFEFEFKNTALRSVLDARYYWALDDDARFVLAGRAQLGTILGGALDELPNDLLFFAGGGGSVRGYPYRSIGVESDGDILGGRSAFELSGEVRARVSDSIGLVGFVDGGLISSESTPWQHADFKAGVGVGLRYQTGLGPIRLDLAKPLHQREGDPSFALYVGIGQAF